MTFVSIARTSIRMWDEKREGEGCEKTLGKKWEKKKITEPNMSAKTKVGCFFFLFFLWGLLRMSPDKIAAEALWANLSWNLRS